jgi:serine/threonine protein kinase
LDKNENVKLCDFGFTREYEGKSNYLQTFCGTVCYSAPEMLKGEKYAGEKVDVWSLGIILFALLAGALPFDEDDDQATKEKILKQDPSYPEGMPEDAKSLIGKLLSKRPLLRPSLSDILADPFLADHAPQQQVLLKFAQPAPFSTPLEKSTLERMRSAGVDIDHVIENVLSQRCDGLAGWWALLIEKEERKERRRERKRKEKEMEAKLARRLSGASSRLDKIAPALIEVDEEGQTPANDDPARNRGRTKRRSTPQILISDLPELPEGCAVETPQSDTPAVPIEKDGTRSTDSSRPPPPPKEHQRRPSNLRLNPPTSESLGLTSRVQKRRSSRRHQLPLLNQLASLKHWLVESAKRARSPAKPLPATSSHKGGTPKDRDIFQTQQGALAASRPKQGNTSPDVANGTHSAAGRSVTPNSPRNMVNAPGFGPSSLVLQPPLDTRNRRHRDSLSPSPMTSHSSFRRNQAGLRGRKSTSSSVSSIRSIHHHRTQSKASSLSSNSIDTVHTPTSKSARSPHTSVKVLPATPSANTTLPSNIRVVRSTFNKNEAAGLNEGVPGFDHSNHGNLASSGGSLTFARRKKSAFKGPMLNTSLFSHSVPGGPGTPRIRAREDNGAERSMGVGRSMSGGSHARKRGSVVIEEEEEEEEEDGEEEVEEVEAFSPVEIRRGESVHSIMVWDEPRPSSGSDGVRIHGYALEGKGKAIQD